MNAPDLRPTAAALLNVEAVAQLLDCSERTVYRKSYAGQMPRPLKIGAMVRWRSSEITQWIADGCPVCRPVTLAAKRTANKKTTGGE